MKNITILINQQNDHERRVLEAIKIVNATQNYFYLKLSDQLISLEKSDKGVNPSELHKAIRKAHPEESLICVISQPFVDNWFSHPYRGCEIITLSDWEELFAPPSLRAYLIYHFTEALLSFEADLSEDMHVRHAHEPPRGCISDFSGHKPDVKLGMVAGNICLECEGTFLRYSISSAALNALRKILGIVRDEAIGRPKIIDTESAFVIMRFSQNDENDNAFKYGVKAGLSEVGLTVRRADDTVVSNQILDKIFHLIERSRFIVAKVDAENLNVYFELGAAMGLGKDVLLIAESSLVLNLPSDLRNWECLTYEKGNYEQLRERIAKFYRDNYGLS